MNFSRRDIFLKIEQIDNYSPLAPIICARRYGRDCMYSSGHEYGRIPPHEIFSASLNALVYREYLDPDYTIPNKNKIIEADINEPPWQRRVPGTMLYTKPGEQLYIHVLNDDKEECHSLHLHGLKYGIDSDGAWPFGVANHDGRRSDEIMPGQRWTYVFNATEETIGAWVFHDHVHHVQQNINRGLFGGLVVRDPSAPCVDHEIPLFIHQMVGVSKSSQFESPILSRGDTYIHTFGMSPESCNYYCRIHGPSMAGKIEVVPGGPSDPNNPVEVEMKDNKFAPQTVTVGPGGKVRWINNEREANHNHIVFATGGGVPTFCLNGRAYVGNTPTILADSGQRLRWYLFNMDLGDIWHNFHPHSARWQLPVPPGGASDVHSLSPSESFVVDTQVPPALRLPCLLEDLQCDPPQGACRVRLKGDFLIHCHLEQHMMAGLAGLLRARQYVWIDKEMTKRLALKLPYDDGTNDCPHVDLTRCMLKTHKSLPTSKVEKSAHQTTEHLHSGEMTK
jgi:FtsP/CotA-like multicopper oxidase with cupredoxin domain